MDSKPTFKQITLEMLSQLPEKEMKKLLKQMKEYDKMSFSTLKTLTQGALKSEHKALVKQGLKAIDTVQDNPEGKEFFVYNLVKHEKFKIESKKRDKVTGYQT